MKEFLISNHVSLFIESCKESGAMPDPAIDEEQLQQMALIKYQQKYLLDDDIDLSEDEINGVFDAAIGATAFKRFLRWNEQGLVDIFVNSNGDLEFIINDTGELYFNEC